MSKLKEAEEYYKKNKVSVWFAAKLFKLNARTLRDYLIKNGTYIGIKTQPHSQKINYKPKKEISQQYKPQLGKSLMAYTDKIRENHKCFEKIMKSNSRI